MSPCMQSARKSTKYLSTYHSKPPVLKIYHHLQKYLVVFSRKIHATSFFILYKFYFEVCNWNHIWSTVLYFCEFLFFNTNISSRIFFFLEAIAMSCMHLNPISNVQILSWSRYHPHSNLVSTLSFCFRLAWKWVLISWQHLVLTAKCTFACTDTARW